MSDQNQNNLTTDSVRKLKKEDHMKNTPSEELTDETIGTNTVLRREVDECFVWGSEYTPQVCISFAMEDPSKERDLSLSGPGAIDLADYLGWAILRHFGPSPQAIWLARAALIHQLDHALMNPGDESWRWKISRTEMEAAEGREWFEKTRANFNPSPYQWSTEEEWIATWKQRVQEQAAECMPSPLRWYGNELF